jgi:neutral amino acid transport system ATP-binding protein
MPTDAAAPAPTPDAEPAEGGDGPILLVNGVTRRFGGLMAVDVDRLEVLRGGITALIGPNGAGKTTLFNLLTGFDEPDSGRWYFDGDEVTGLRPYQIAQAGMVRTFQLTKVLGKMSVLDNMKVAACNQRGERIRWSVVRKAWVDQERGVEHRALELLDDVGLAHMRHEYAATLSGGQRKLLELARALMVEPRMLLLDEPTAGVNPVLIESLLDQIRRLRLEGLTVLFVEHDMDVVMGISDRVVCMAEGRVIADGTPAGVAADPLVIDAYLGTRTAEETG